MRMWFKILILIYSGLIIIESKCGHPGMPANEDIYKATFENWFEENSKLEYKCEHPSWKPIPKQSEQIRFCKLGKWNGTLGRCARDVSKHVSLESIIVTSVDSTKVFLNTKDVTDGGTTNIRINSSQQRCFTSGSRNPQKWLLMFDKPFIVNYLELEMKSNDVKPLKYSSLQVSISKYRFCKFFDEKEINSKDAKDDIMKRFLKGLKKDFKNAQSTEDSKTRLVSFLCELLPNITIDEVRSREALNFEEKYKKNISITMSKESFSEVTLCSIKTYRFNPTGCGRPESPINGHVYKIDPKNYNEDYDEERPQTGYFVKYSCNEGFLLENNNEDRIYCSPDGQWIGKIPSCKPEKTCPLFLRTDSNDSKPTVNYKDMIYYDGDLIAIKDTTAMFLCPGYHVSTNRTYLFGDRVLTCASTGVWDGDEPVCVDLHTYKLLSQKSLLLPSSSPVLQAVILTLLITIAIFGVMAGVTLYLVILKTRGKRIDYNPKPKLPKDFVENEYESPQNPIEYDEESVYETVDVDYLTVVPGDYIAMDHNASAEDLYDRPNFENERPHFEELIEYENIDHQKYNQESIKMDYVNLEKDELTPPPLPSPKSVKRTVPSKIIRTYLGQ